MAKHEDRRLQRALSPIKSRFYCRSCLGEEAKMMSLLDEPIRTAFRDCTSILVNQSDTVSTMICLMCVRKCQAAKHFRDLATASDHKLKLDSQIESMDSDSGEIIIMDITGSEPSQTCGISMESGIQVEEKQHHQQEEEEVGCESSLYEVVKVDMLEEEEVVVVIDNEVIIEEEVEEQDEIDETGEVEEEGVKEGQEEEEEYEEEEEEHFYVTEEETEEYEPIEYVLKTAVATSAKSPKKRNSQNIQCEFCGEEANNRMRMTRHYMDKHPDQQYSCAVCGLKFLSAQTWRTHSCSLSPVPCETCGKEFTKKSSLHAHRRTHLEDGQNRFVCKICGQGFVNKFYYKKHEARHSAHIKEFECSECGKLFTENIGLRKHYQLKHTNIRPFECEQCGKRFAFDYMLKRHTQVHTGIRPFKCTFESCGVSLSSGNALKHHMFTHTGEKPYKCEKCDSSFRIFVKLKQHVAKFHN